MAKLIAPFVLKDFNKVLHSEYPKFEDFLRAVVRNRLEFARSHLPIIKIMLHEIPFQTELQAWDEEQEIEYSINFIMHGLAPRDQ
jgi:hypothetical protein